MADVPLDTRGASKCVIHSTSPALPTLLEGRRLCVGDGLTCLDCAPGAP